MIITNMNKELYYIYVYLDPRKPGDFIYDNYKFKYEPIYIGKGKKNRFKKHLYIHKNNNNRFYNKISSIVNSGYKPIIEILFYNITDEQYSHDLEKNIIKRIGRIENSGTLTNLTDGGDGISGFKHSDEFKREQSIRNKGENNKNYGKKMSQETKDLISRSKKGRVRKYKLVMTEEQKRKVSEAKKKQIENGEWVNPMSGKKHKKESIEKMKLNTKRLFGEDNPNFGRIIPESEKTFDTWIIGDIDGNFYIIDNLCKFCSENGLNASCMRDIYYGNSKHHKHKWVYVMKLTNNVKKRKL
jgi:hypothetical protein